MTVAEFEVRRLTELPKPLEPAPVRFLRVVPAAGICFAIGMSAQAHQVNLSTARVTISECIVAVEVALKGSDADRLASTNVFDRQRDLVDSALVAVSAQQIIAYVNAHVAVTSRDGTP